MLIVLLAWALLDGRGQAGLVAYWGFDDSDGFTAREDRGGLDGAFIGDVRRVAGRVGKALQFDGDGDYVLIKHDPALDIHRAITIAAWVQSGAFEKQFATVIAKGDSSWRIARDGGKDTLQFAANIGNRLWVVNGRTKVNDQKWHHIVAVFDGARACLYVDGELDAEIQADRPFDANRFDVCIGENAERTGRFWKGLIDDVLVLDHPLDAAQVKSLHTRGAKSYVDDSLGPFVGAIAEARKVLIEQGPSRATVFARKKLGSYGSRSDPSGLAPSRRVVLSEFYHLLATAQSSGETRARDVAQSYRQAVTACPGSRGYVPALLWLFRNTEPAEYADTVRASMKNNADQYGEAWRIAAEFETSGNWPAFESFLDAALPAGSDQMVLADAIGRGLAEGSTWSEAFTEYCRQKEPLKPYYARARDKAARASMDRHEFVDAAAIYRSIVAECGSAMGVMPYELGLCECLLCDGQYRQAIAHIDRFVEQYGAGDGDEVRQAVLLKGRARMQLGETAQAVEIFSRLADADPASVVTPEARFLLGYCCMKQQDFDRARRILTALVETHPKSPFAGKARLCLRRIERVGQAKERSDSEVQEAE